MSYDGKRLKISLNDKNGIRNALKVLENYGKRDDANVTKFIEKMVDKGVKYAQSICPVDTGLLRGSIRGKVETSTYKIKGTISVGTDHAAFVEFGTGVVGQGTYPNIAQTVYAYDVNGHGEDGWNYFDDARQQFFHTKGQEANPFMYETAKYLNGVAIATAGEVANDK